MLCSGRLPRAHQTVCPPAASSTPTCPWTASPPPLGLRPCVATATAYPGPAPRSSSAPPTRCWSPARAQMCVSLGPHGGGRGQDLGRRAHGLAGRGCPRCSDRTQAQGKRDGGQSMGGTAGGPRPARQLRQHLLPSGALTVGVDASGPHPYTGCRWPSPPAYCEEVASRCFTSGTGHSTVMKPAGHGWAGGLGASGSWKPSGRGSAPGSRDGGHTGPEMGDEAVRGGDGKGRVQKCPVL